jgi:hypothetical protein
MEMRSEWNLPALVTASIFAITACIGFSTPASALSDFGFYTVDMDDLSLGLQVTNNQGGFTWNMTVTNNSGQLLEDLYVIVPSAGDSTSVDFDWDNDNGKWVGTSSYHGEFTTGFTRLDTNQTPWLQAKVNGINGQGNFTTGDSLPAVYYGDLADGAALTKTGLRVNASTATGQFWMDFNAAAVPEPSTALLLAIGVAGLAAVGRRRSLN